MSFREADKESETKEKPPYAVEYGRPKLQLPLEDIIKLRKQGMSLRDMVTELRKRGIKTSKDTIQRRLKICSKNQA